MEIIVTVGATLLCTIGVLVLAERILLVAGWFMRLGARKNNKIDIV